MKKIAIKMMMCLGIGTFVLSGIAAAQQSAQSTIDAQPKPTPQQMDAFRKGDIAELSQFIGKNNTVVLIKLSGIL